MTGIYSNSIFVMTGPLRMPKANRYATFPSLSAGWVFSNERVYERLQKLLSRKVTSVMGEIR